MAAYHAEYLCDLAKPSQVIAIPYVFAMGDNRSHTFTALVYDSDDPECGLMAGTVSGLALRPDGGTVPLTGTKESAVREIALPDGSTVQATACSVTLIQGCFACAGQIVIVIRLADGETRTAVFAGRGTVTRSLTDTVVDPGEVVADIAGVIADAEQAAADAEEALAQAEAVVTYAAQTGKTEAQKAQARANIGAEAAGAVAAGYDGTASYTAGQYAMHEGTLYRATANTAGTWTGADWTAVTVVGEMTADKTALAAETAARETGEADIFMEPWQLMMKKRFAAEGTEEFVIRRNHIVYTPRSSATVSNLRTLVGTYRSTNTSLGNYTPSVAELIPVSVFGSKIKMGLYIGVTDGVDRIPRFAYKFCTVSGDTVTGASYGTIPGTPVAGQICEGTVDVPENATHVYFGMLFTGGFNVGTYDMVYKVDRG